MRLLNVTSVFCLVAAAASADVKVRLHDGQMDILATRVSISEILDRIATQTGMKVIYDGPRPQKMLTKSVTNRSPADAVLGILEGEGLNFAVILNPAGTQIETLLVTGPAKVKGAPLRQNTGGSPLPVPGQADGWSVEVDEPPPPPPPPAPPIDNGDAPPPPPDAAGQGQNATPPPTPMTLPSPTPMPSSPFTPQGPGPILLPPLGTPTATPPR
jgi:hypothetical protein